MSTCSRRLLWRRQYGIGEVTDLLHRFLAEARASQKLMPWKECLSTAFSDVMEKLDVAWSAQLTLGASEAATVSRENELWHEFGW